MAQNKYHNQPVTIDGIRFASKREGKRYSELKLLEQAGSITDLKLQPRFPIRHNLITICAYVADFQYTDCSTGKTIVEDTKGFRTQVFKLKKKLVKAFYNLDIREV